MPLKNLNCPFQQIFGNMCQVLVYETSQQSLNCLHKTPTSYDHRNFFSFLYQLFVSIWWNTFFPALKSQPGAAASYHVINVAPEKSTWDEFDDEVCGPGLSYCSIPGSQDDVEPVAGGVNGSVTDMIKVFTKFSFLTPSKMCLRVTTV